MGLCWLIVPLFDARLVLRVKSRWGGRASSCDVGYMQVEEEGGRSRQRAFLDFVMALLDLRVELCTGMPGKTPFVIPFGC